MSVVRDIHEPEADVCLIEDDDAQNRLYARYLERMGLSVVVADSGPAGIQAVYKHRPRVIVCDLQLPDISGVQICRQVRADPTLDGTYIILITASDRSGPKTRALDAGADDYIKKPFDELDLRARVQTALRLNRLQERLRLAAQTDGLTGIWNATHFRRLLEREFARTRRYGVALSLLMIDLDNFKALNDTFGHEVGNEVLQGVARALQRSIRDVDIAARYGGEEFAVICPDTRLPEAARLAERIRIQVAERVRSASYPQVCVTTSVGVASVEDPRASSMDGLINLSDQALYESKRRGRNRVTRCDEIGDVIGPPVVQVGEVERLRKEVVALSMRSKELCLQSVWALIQALEARDGYSAWHSRNVTVYTKILVEAAGWSDAMRSAAANAAMLHDLGKIGVPDALLLKPRPLDPEEAAVLRHVPLITCRILEPLRVFETEIQMIRHLRERYDGSGYPDGLVADSIPIGSRIIAIAEAFDSLTCDRAFRPGKTLEEAVEIIADASGSQFDPEFVALFQRVLERNPELWHAQMERTRQPIDDEEFFRLKQLFCA